mmetsp:Transcript_17367/g.19456  ORF Transcript_17367/g.19456 Transcript_17367/m.19456 type:complete len:165 (-) Transcript_17367:10-504(-)
MIRALRHGRQLRILSRGVTRPSRVARSGPLVARPSFRVARAAALVASPSPLPTRPFSTASHTELDTRKRRILYRCKQRGILELDLIFGNWADENLPGLNGEELDQFEAIVALENVDLRSWLIDMTAPIPKEHYTPVMQKVEAYVHDTGKRWFTSASENKKTGNQ